MAMDRLFTGKMGKRERQRVREEEREGEKEREEKEQVFCCLVKHKELFCRFLLRSKTGT